jgi:hypothetical protein
MYNLFAHSSSTNVQLLTDQMDEIDEYILSFMRTPKQRDLMQGLLKRYRKEASKSAEKESGPRLLWEAPPCGQMLHSDDKKV